MLLLSGVAAVKDGVLHYRNRIVREAFGTRWVKSVAPLGWRTVATTAAAVAFAGGSRLRVLELRAASTTSACSSTRARIPPRSTRRINGLHRLPGFAARADELLAHALRRRSSDATDVDALVTTDSALRALPGQTQVADRLLADFWLRKTADCRGGEQRDAALLFALRAALAGGGGAEEARAWVGALVGGDYAELSRTFDLASAPARWGVDWQSGMLLAIESDARRSACAACAAHEGRRRSAARAQRACILRRSSAPCASKRRATPASSSSASRLLTRQAPSSR